MRLLAIDPGNTESAYVVINTRNCKPLAFDKADNNELRRAICAGNFADCDGAVIEMVASYGMPVGKDVFDTCVWVGRLTEAIRLTRSAPPQPALIYRQPIKLHHCGSARAKDSNVTHALVDRFTPGQPNHGKGTKAAPGWFHGFRADVWQAYALAVYAADTLTSPTPATAGNLTDRKGA